MLCWNRQCTLVGEGRQAVVSMFDLVDSALTMRRSFCYLRGEKYPQMIADERRGTEAGDSGLGGLTTNSYLT